MARARDPDQMVLRLDAQDPDLEVQRYDANPMPPVRKTIEGFLIAPATRLARTGVQEYYEDGRVVRELRLPEEVFAAASLETAVGKPLTLEHPDEVRHNGEVTAANARELVRGSVAGHRRDGDYLVGDVSITHADAVEQVERGGARDISAGYKCRRERVAGGVYRKDGDSFDGVLCDYIQRGIKYNHFAAVPAGRANTAADHTIRLRLDSAGNQLPQKEKTMDEEITLPDGTKVLVPKAVAAAWRAEKQRADTAETARVDEKKKSDEAIARADAALSLKQKAEQDEKQRAVQYLLVREAEAITKKKPEDLLKLKPEELRREILVAKEPGIDPEKLSSDAYVQARLDMIAEQSKTHDSASALRMPTSSIGGETKRADASAPYGLEVYYAERAQRHAANGKKE